MPSRRPVVSVLTPTYNHARFIEECVSSVLAQDFEDWEMFVLDDGSLDGTADIAAKYDDPRIKVIRLAHRGLDRLAETYNIGLAETTGEFVAILEGDDLWPPHKLAIQVDDFQRTEIALSSGRFEIVDSDGTSARIEPEVLPPADARTNSPVGRATYHMLDPDRLMYTFPVTVVMRRSALSAIGGFQQYPELPLVDLPTFLAMGLQGEWAFHDDVLGRWRRHADSTTLNRFPTILNKGYELVTQFYCDNAEAIPASPEEIARTDRRWADRQRERLICLARLLDHDGKRAQAIQALKPALDLPIGAKSKAMITAALACWRLGLSAETVFIRSNRGAFPGALTTPSGDPFVTLDTDTASLRYRPFVRKEQLKN